MVVLGLRGGRFYQDPFRRVTGAAAGCALVGLARAAVDQVSLLLLSLIGFLCVFTADKIGRVDSTFAVLEIWGGIRGMKAQRP